MEAHYHALIARSVASSGSRLSVSVYDPLSRECADLEADIARVRQKVRGGWTSAAQPAWLASCITKNGQPMSTLANVMIALRNDPAVKDALAYDEMLRTPMLMHACDNDPDFSPRPVTDADVGHLQEWQRQPIVVIIKRTTLTKTSTDGMKSATKPTA
jgi:hypothetical protein